MRPSFGQRAKFLKANFFDYHHELCLMKLLKRAIDDGFFLLDVQGEDLTSVFRQTLNHVVAQGLISTSHRDQAEVALLEQERQSPSSLGSGVAVPHAYLDVVERPVVVLVRLAQPFDMNSPDGIPTRFLFVLLGPPSLAAEHLDTLLHIVRLMQDDELRNDFARAIGKADLLAALDRFWLRTTVPPPAEKQPVGLAYTGRFCGGIIDDLRRRLPYYLQDFRDGLHPKCLSSVLFLFFACLAPAVTFGGFMATATDGQIGTVEMIVATAICGTLYALLAGQPLLILGGTGPLLVFTGVLYALCRDWGIAEHFLAVYAWVGMWTALFLILLSVTDASFLMRYFTRFTDEIFSALISLIFIYESIHAVVHVFQEAYSKQSVSHDTALLTLLLTLGTFYIATNLSRFRKSRYLLPRVREFLSDFGPALAMAAMTVVALSLRGAVDLVPLRVPETFGTTSGRGWLVNPFTAPPWVWLAAAGPAMLATVLVFLDQNITGRLMNSPKHKLQKGEAYHWDLAVCGGLIGLSSIFGLPWLVAATVRSLNHLKSLATVEETAAAGGDRQERIVHVRETRLTGLAIHVAIGGSLLLLPLLRNIPMAVLFGLFLYMGIVSMHGNQFFERMNLWLMDANLYPSTHYLKKVPRRIIHQFTALQLMGLVILWAVKVSSLAILFPLFIALGIPVRLLANRLFEPQHLAALDADEEPEEDETR